MAAAKECAAAAVEALETNDAAALVSAFRGAAASAVNEKVVGGKLADTPVCPPLECEDGDTLLHLYATQGSNLGPTDLQRLRPKLRLRLRLRLRPRLRRHAAAPVSDRHSNLGPTGLQIG